MRRSILILDSALMVVYIIGHTSESLILKHNNTKEYNVEDFRLLNAVVRQYPRLLLLPNIITEVSSLIGQTNASDAGLIRQQLKYLIDYHEEYYVMSRIAATMNAFNRLGITDCAIVEAGLAIAKQQPRIYKATILTTDHNLCLLASKHGLIATNFNHLREEAGTV